MSTVGIEGVKRNVEVTQKELAEVDKLLSKQNALKAGVLGSLWCVLSLWLWYFTYLQVPDIAATFILISGLVIGGAVRMHGRGYTIVFSLIAFLLHALLIYAAVLLNILLPPGSLVWASVLLGMCAGGAWLAVFTARKKIPFELHRAFFRLTEIEPHSSYKTMKNRWFISLPVMAVLSSGLMLVSTSFLYVFDIAIEAKQAEEFVAQRQESFENIAISVEVNDLDKLTTKVALRHAYAFYSGTLLNKYGYFESYYPSSTYKAKTILKYLVSERQEPRAKFILGMMTIEEDGISLVREASNDGDSYARIYDALRFACNGNNKMATDMLTRYKNTNRDPYIARHIESIFEYGFHDACDESRVDPFQAEFVKTFQ